MPVNIKVTGGLNIEWGQIDPKGTGGLRKYKSQCRIFKKKIFLEHNTPKVKDVTG